MTKKTESIMSAFLITGLILTSLMIVGNGIIFWKLNQARTNQDPCVPEISMAEITEEIFNSFDFGYSIAYDIENGTNQPLMSLEYQIYEGWFFYFWDLSSTTNLTNITWHFSIANHRIIDFNDFKIDEVLLLFMSYNEFGNSTLHIILDGPWHGDTVVYMDIEDVSNVLLIALIDKEVFT